MYSRNLEMYILYLDIFWRSKNMQHGNLPACQKGEPRYDAKGTRLFVFLCIFLASKSNCTCWDKWLFYKVGPLLLTNGATTPISRVITSAKAISRGYKSTYNWIWGPPCRFVLRVQSYLLRYYLLGGFKDLCILVALKWLCSKLTSPKGCVCMSFQNPGFPGTNPMTWGMRCWKTINPTKCLARGLDA